MVDDRVRRGRGVTATRTASCVRRARSSDHASARGTQLVQIEVAVAEIEQLRAELVLVAVDVLLDEAVRLQRPQQAVDGALREAEPRRYRRHRAGRCRRPGPS